MKEPIAQTEELTRRVHALETGFSVREVDLSFSTTNRSEPQEVCKEAARPTEALKEAAGPQEPWKEALKEAARPEKFPRRL